MNLPTTLEPVARCCHLHREGVTVGRVRVAAKTAAGIFPTLIRPAATFSRWEKDCCARNIQSNPTASSHLKNRHEKIVRNEPNGTLDQMHQVCRSAIPRQNEAKLDVKKLYETRPNRNFGSIASILPSAQSCQAKRSQTRRENYTKRTRWNSRIDPSDLPHPRSCDKRRPSSAWKWFETEPDQGFGSNSSSLPIAILRQIKSVSFSRRRIALNSIVSRKRLARPWSVE